MSRATLRRFRHNDLNHLEDLLKGRRSGQTWIAIESIYSTDGTEPNCAALLDLAHRYNAKLYVDEAHAFGVCGRQGIGLFPKADVRVVTLGKAAGVSGAFCQTSPKVKEQLINRCTGLIYTTALPPMVLAAIAASLELIPSLDAERARIKSHAQLLGASSHIHPLVAGSDQEALTLHATLLNEGFLGALFRPPTVPEGRACVRLSLSAAHTLDEVRRLKELIDGV